MLIKGLIKHNDISCLIISYFSESNLLYKDNNGYSYYGMPVANGKRLVEGAVPDTCEAVGMEAVCSGPSGCGYNSARCVVTPLSTDCYSPMRGISMQICNVGDPRQCSALEGLFNYAANWDGSECGVVGNKWCAKGADYVSGDPITYFAYCILK